ncbi:MAG: glycosyltransferase [Actinomycetota bacterium]
MDGRVVVCSLGGDFDPWHLPASGIVERTWIHGGERSLYEFATAAAAAGAEVELRGEIVASALDQMTETAGAKVSVGLDPRRPEPDDILVVPEGWTDPLAYGRVAFSPARALLLILGPPGLVGWDFRDRWVAPDILTVDPRTLARPESFRGMDALGFELLTNAVSLEEAARAAGVACTYVGRRTPLPYPPAEVKTHDVVVVGSNRWAGMAEDVEARLQTDSIQRIDAVGNAEMLRLLGTARVLPWPAPIDTTSRFMNEARAMGTVPVVLDTPFLRDVNEDTGAVLVHSLDEMVGAVDDLLADPGRLARLSERAMRAARGLTDWGRYVQRVGDVLSGPASDQAVGPNEGARSARAALGRSIDAYLGDAAAAELEDGPALRTAHDALRRRSADSWAAFADRQQDLRLELDRLRREAVASDRSYEREIAVREEQIAQLLATKTFRYTAALRGVYGRLLGRRKRGEDQP